MKKSLLILLIFIIMWGSVSCKKQHQNETETTQQTTVLEIPQIKNYSKTTGKEIEKNNYPIAVVMPNDDTARPHTGIKYADVVYEFIVEGGITRFVSIFSDNMPEKVGPVRSLRIYMVDVVDDWNSGLVHFGGAKQGTANAYNRLNKSDVEYEYDGLTVKENFSRDNKKRAPNNAYYALSELSNSINKKMDWQGPLKFSNEFAYENSKNSNSVSIAYSGNNKVIYEYDVLTNTYKRFIGKKEFIDASDNSQIAPTNIIIQQANTKIISGDTSGRLNIFMVGSGNATYYINGKVINGKWEKISTSYSTKYMDEDGNEMKFLPGQTFVQVIKSDIKVS